MPWTIYEEELGPEDGGLRFESREKALEAAREMQEGSGDRYCVRELDCEKPKDPAPD
jgi:hypothetical protein